MDLNKEIQKATNDYIISDEFKETVQKNVREMINGRISDALKSYGDIAKQIDEYIKQQCVINLNNLPAIGLTKLMTATVDEELNTLLRDDLRDRIKERILTITEPMPKEIDFMELLNKIYKEKIQYDSCYCGDGESDLDDVLCYESLRDIMTVIIEEDNRGGDYYDIWLDESPNTEKNRCDFHIGVNKNYGHIVFYSTSNTRSNEKPLNSFYGVASCLYKLEVQDSKIKVDSIKEFIDNYMW